jgi:hypothetical protein
MLSEKYSKCTKFRDFLLLSSLGDYPPPTTPDFTERKRYVSIQTTILQGASTGTNHMEHGSSWEASSHSASRESYQPFVEPEALLPCSQDPTTGPYSKPHVTSPHLPTLLPSDSY